ncbi:large ribosomal subunit protein uL3m-like [Diadema antillarum]|uniref:large ribosomal subunit protein uL3m-like n=1 Tax=Diadema antillarum TaxID=105358 RepID=UPI003A8692C6
MSMNIWRRLDEFRLLIPAAVSASSGPVRHYYPQAPKRDLFKENYERYRQRPQEGDLTEENEEFLYKWSSLKNMAGPSPLKHAPWPRGEWTPESKRTGVVAVKLGMQPLWTKAGAMVPTTLLQVLECNVVDFIPKGLADTEKHALMIVAAKNASPYYKDEEYAEQFKRARLPIKEHVTGFQVTDDAALQPGTPLLAGHFRPGMYVDIAAKTIDKGFQGVMKRWGMKGQPASHGATKTHRKMGASGGGGDPGRIWPGKKMPGFMGNRLRWTMGLKILRVNTKHNVLYVNGSIHGRVSGFVKVKDSLIHPLSAAPPFPTYYPDEEVGEDVFDESIHNFTDPSIEYEVDQEEET